MLEELARESVGLASHKHRDVGMTTRTARFETNGCGALRNAVSDELAVSRRHTRDACADGRIPARQLICRRRCDCNLCNECLGLLRPYTRYDDVGRGLRERRWKWREQEKTERCREAARVAVKHCELLPLRM
ncbi:MAG: hypothetical protein ABL932_05505 [Terricaulis sp.]